MVLGVFSHPYKEIWPKLVVRHNYFMLKFSFN